MMNIQGVSVDEARLEELCSRYYVRELAMFGSRARGDNRKDSDLDILVEFYPNSPIGLIEYDELEDELAGLFALPVDLVSRKWLKPIVRDQVLPEARQIYVSTRSRKVN